MTAIPVNTDLLVKNVFELDAAIQGGNKKAVDERIEAFMEQLGSLRPEVAPQISKLIEKADISHIPTFVPNFSGEHFLVEGIEKLKGMEREILAIVSKAMPELNINAKLNQQNNLAQAIIEAQKNKSTHGL
jgi:hypothetical protein